MPLVAKKASLYTISGSSVGLSPCNTSKNSRRCNGDIEVHCWSRTTSLARKLCLFVVIRDFKMPRRRRQRERQKAIVRIGKIKTLHVHQAFLFISLPSLHDYDGKMLNFTCYGERKQATAVEGLNVMNGPKCNEVLNVIIFCPKCN